MTERKPAGMPFETWVDKAIREAAERGAFDDLPGAGKPIPGLDDSEDWWLRGFLRREGVSNLPPTLALRKEVEDAVAAVPAAPSEAAVRQLVDRLNARITAAIRIPPAGPPLNLRPLDADELATTWRNANPPPPEQPAAPPTPARRRWLRRSRG